MTSRERVLAALNHREADRVPFDLGATVVTGIHERAHRALRERLGLPPAAPRILDLVQQLAPVGDDLAERLGVDVRGVWPGLPSAWRPAISRDETGEHYRDEFGIGWRKPRECGWYFDMVDHPLAGSISEADIERFAWPDPRDPARFADMREAARRVVAEEQRALVVGGMCAGILEVYSWVRGYTDFFTDLHLDYRRAAKMMDRVLDLQLGYWERALDVVGDFADVAFTADDFAGQQRLLISPDTYRALVKPRHRELFGFIHAKSRARVFFHSCGAIRGVIPDLIEAGVDILNPVQVSADGMDTAALKREYGRDLTFWGGGVDTQHVLGRGTPSEVRDEVRRRVTDLKAGGGFVFSAVHNVQPDVPAANIVAMCQALAEFGAYGGAGDGDA